MKKLIIAGVIIVIVGVGGYFVLQNMSAFTALNKQKEQEETKTPEVVVPQEEPKEEEAPKDDTKTVIGTSAQGNEITAYHFGKGKTELLFIGGIHGGYSWNTVLLAYEFMDYLAKNPEFVPENVKVTVIPVMNPDGLDAVVGTTSRFVASDVPTAKDATVPGRFNGNDVDLNRNFDCDWQEKSVWQNKTVSGGSEVFSESESKAIRDYINSNELDAVVVWYSASGGVFASNCHGDVLPETSDIMKLYADASGYKAFKEFNFYEITGDMVNWFAKEGIPAISVLLTTHNTTEWNKNKAGIEALLKHYED